MELEGHKSKIFWKNWIDQMLNNGVPLSLKEDIDKSNLMSWLSQETKLSKDLQTRFYIFSWSSPSNIGQNLIAMGPVEPVLERVKTKTNQYSNTLTSPQEIFARALKFSRALVEARIHFQSYSVTPKVCFFNAQCGPRQTAQCARWTPEKLNVTLRLWKTKFGANAAPAKKRFCKKPLTTAAVFRPAIKSVLIMPFVR